MPSQYTNHAFEAAIEHQPMKVGEYLTGDRDGFDPYRTKFPAVTGLIDNRREVV